jgi:hypothetical protein
METAYEQFLRSKMVVPSERGLPCRFLPAQTFDFQASLAEWALGIACGAIFADCGLGKTLIELIWAENIVRATNGQVLLLTPLAVAAQTERDWSCLGSGFEMAIQGSR